MHKISDKDKRIWKYYISNLNTIKKVDKKKEFKLVNGHKDSKVLKPNTSFELNSKTKRQLKNKKVIYDAIVDLHGKSEIQAHEIIKNFIRESYLKNFKMIMIITGKGANCKGKLKLKTPTWLKSEELSKFIVGFETMPHNKGGEGALFVKLKNINKYK